jgi:amino acid adenylation domain-containing protein
MRYLLTHAISYYADKSPHQEAIRFSGQCLTYQDLEDRTNRLARTLIELGVKRGDRVGIFMNKSLESAVAIYGIMKAGGAYVPLDPLSPVNRAAFVIQDCRIRHLVTREDKLESVRQILDGKTGLEHLIGVSPEDGLPVSFTPWEEVNKAPSLPLELNLTEQDLAYILYTSGSTGSPKGIMHTHRSGLSFAEWATDAYALTQADRVSNHAPLHFDLSTFDFFAGAVAGATTVIIPEALTKFPANLSKLIQDEMISVWYSVPFALIQLMQRGGLEAHDLSALRWVLFAGEVFPTKHLRQLMVMLPDKKFSNLYGPTETNVCTYYHVTEVPQDDEPIPIGKPCANIEDLVVDLDDRPVHSGDVGELLIRGGVVMKGYWGQPEKTAQGFYRRRTFENFEDIFYRTGDLVQLDPNGDYRYLGRKDRQIKTRGYRVELDEIESALLTNTVIEEVAAFPVPDAEGSNLIEAAVTLKQGAVIDEADLINYLVERLPHYAIPVRINMILEFPRTSTGKINRRELQREAIDIRNSLKNS